MSKAKHPSLKCPVCGHPRAFLEYGTKPGKDGRTAKWPIYEQCPNRNDPSKHPHKLADEVAPIMQTTIDRALVARALPKGAMYQADEIGQPLADVGPCIEHYAGKRGQLPRAIAVNPADTAGFDSIEVEIEGGEVLAIPVEPMKCLSPGYGYLFLIE